MRVRQVLQLLVLLVVVSPAHHALLAEEASTSWEAGEVPQSQMRMLSLGLAHLLHGVEENAGQLERAGGQAAAELDGVIRSVETLHKQSLQAGRTHRQARKDLQILSARGDRLWRTVKELQKLLEDVETDQRTEQHRLDRVLRRVRGLTEPGSGGPGSGGRGQPEVSSMKVIVDKQTRRLASLTSVVSAREKLIDRRLQRIEHLEKHARNLRASDSVPAALRPDSDRV